MKLLKIKFSKKNLFILAGSLLFFIIMALLMVHLFSKRNEKIKSYTENIKKRSKIVADSQLNDVNIKKLDSSFMSSKEFDVEPQKCSCCRKLFEFYYVKGLYHDALTYFDQINFDNLNYSTSDSLFLKKAICQSKLQLFSDALNTLKLVKSLDISPYEFYVKGKNFLFLGQRDSLIKLVKDFSKHVFNFKKKSDNFIYYSMLLFESGAPLENVSKLLKKSDSFFVSNNDYRLCALRGKILHKQRKYKKAILEFKKGLLLYPFNNELRNLVAISYYYEKNYKDALNNINIAISVSNQDYFTYYNRGQIYITIGKDSLAFNDYKKSYELNKNYYYSLINMAKIYTKYGKINKAILVAQRAFNLINKLKNGAYNKEDIEFVLFLSKLYIKKNSELFFKKADSLVVKICILDPQNDEALKLYEHINGRIFRLSNYR